MVNVLRKSQTGPIRIDRKIRRSNSQAEIGLEDRKTSMVSVAPGCEVPTVAFGGAAALRGVAGPA